MCTLVLLITRFTYAPSSFSYSSFLSCENWVVGIRLSQMRTSIHPHRSQRYPRLLTEISSSPHPFIPNRHTRRAARLPFLPSPSRIHRVLMGPRQASKIPRCKERGARMTADEESRWVVRTEWCAFGGRTVGGFCTRLILYYSFLHSFLIVRCS